MVGIPVELPVVARQGSAGAVSLSTALPPHAPSRTIPDGLRIHRAARLNAVMVAH
jgi:hypothetical protein